MKTYQHEFTPDNSRLGSELSKQDQQKVLAAFVHRMTTEARRQWPEFARRMVSGGYRMPGRNDAQWLAETHFATDSLGRLNDRVSNCQATHESTMRDLALVRESDAVAAMGAGI